MLSQKQSLVIAIVIAFVIGGAAGVILTLNQQNRVNTFISNAIPILETRFSSEASEYFENIFVNNEVVELWFVGGVGDIVSIDFETRVLIIENEGDQLTLFVPEGAIVVMPDPRQSILLSDLSVGDSVEFTGGVASREAEFDVTVQIISLIARGV